MNEITTYTRLLKVRNLFKRIQQVSWVSSRMEQRFDIDDLPPEQLSNLLDGYFEFLNELKEIINELERESK